MDLVRIFKEAFTLTKNHKSLWFFGFLLVGIPMFEGVDTTGLDLILMRVWQEILANPHKAAFVSFVAIILIGVLFVLMSYAKVVLAIRLKDILENNKRESHVSTVLVYKVMKISIVTTSLYTACLLILVPIMSMWTLNPNPQEVGFQVGMVLLFGLSFVFTCLNIFASLFAIWYSFGVKKSFDLTVDLLTTSWSSVLAVGSMMLVVQAIWYGSCFVVTNIITSAFKAAPWGLIQGQSDGLIELVIKVILWWTFAAIYSIFFNVVLAIFFKEIIAKSEKPESTPEPAYSAAQ